MAEKIVMFGDSLTFGFGVNKKDSICSLLEKDGYTVINSGLNGDTTRYALRRIEKDVLCYDADIVTILFGSNDSAPYENVYITPYEFEENISKMIDIIHDINKHAKIVLITPPPVDDAVFMPYTTNKRLSKYVDVIRNISENKNCILCDLNAYMTFASKGDISSYLQEDGCHISEKGYICFYNCVINTIKDL